jgi:multidrug efflux pump
MLCILYGRGFLPVNVGWHCLLKLSVRKEGFYLLEPQNKNKKQDRTYILENMPVGKAIWTLAIPTMTAMLIQVIYNMTDTFFIGKLNNPHMVAAIAISMPVFMIIQGFGNVFAVGGASLISRLLGKGEMESASQAGAIAFWSALIVCSLFDFYGGFACLVMRVG